MSAVLTPKAAPDMEFRPLRDADAEAMAAIEREVYVFPWTVGNFRDSLFAGYHCAGGFIGNELVAYSVMMHALDEGHLLNLAVKKSWQSMGLGAAILTHVLAQARLDRRSVLYLEVRPSNIAALALYARFGFTQMGLRRDYYPAVTGREDALFLGITLTAEI